MKYQQIGTRVRVTEPGRVYTISFVDEQIKGRPKVKITREVVAVCEIQSFEGDFLEFNILVDLKTEVVTVNNSNVHLVDAQILKREESLAKKAKK